MAHACRPAPEAKAEEKVMARERLRRRRGLGYILRKLQKKRVRVNGKRVRPEMQQQAYCTTFAPASAFNRLRHHSTAAGNPQDQLTPPSECSEIASAPVQTNLLKLAQQVVRNRKVKEVAGDEPQNRDMLHREIIEAIPGQDLRPGAFKMQLRAGEEAGLPLVAPNAQVSLSAQMTLSGTVSMQHEADRPSGAAYHAGRAVWPEFCRLDRACPHMNAGFACTGHDLQPQPQIWQPLWGAA